MEMGEDGAHSRKPGALPSVIKMFGECGRRDLRSIWLRTPCR
jgi:hypothetical protein